MTKQATCKHYSLPKTLPSLYQNGEQANEQLVTANEQQKKIGFVLQVAVCDASMTIRNTVADYIKILYKKSRLNFLRRRQSNKT